MKEKNFSEELGFLIYYLLVHFNGFKIQYKNAHKIH